MCVWNIPITCFHTSTLGSTHLNELVVFTLQHILYDPFPLKYNNDGLLLTIQTLMKVS